MAIESPTRLTTSTMKTTPSRRRRTVAGSLRDATSTSQPDAGVRAPDRERQEEVDDVEGHDRRAYRLADGHTDTGRTARRRVTVVAVRQDHDDREDQDLHERPDHVLRRQEQMEVVRVGARRVVEV